MTTAAAHSPPFDDRERGAPSRWPLRAWALGASAALHAALVLLPVGGFIGGSANPPTPIPHVIEARLIALPVLTPQMIEPARIERPPASAAPMLTRARLAEWVPAKSPSDEQANARRAGLDNVGVPAALLVDRSRMGDMVARQTNEFPIEIDSPVRLDEPIQALYPPAALTDGREGRVTVWVVVDPEGHVEETQVTEGEPEFAEPVLAALKDARFVPARNNLKPIRFPIALEFRFAVASPNVTATGPSAN